jgi:hypothetical protein
MFRSLKDLEEYTIGATDGDVGSVVNFLLDDERWVVRYLVAKTGGIFGGRQVLISPISFRQADWSTRRFYLALTVDKIRNSPSFDLDKPVSRQHELDHFAYYGYPRYWGYRGLWGMGTNPGYLAAGGSKRTRLHIILRHPTTSICVAPRRSADTTSRELTRQSATSPTSSSTMRHGKCGIS